MGAAWSANEPPRTGSVEILNGQTSSNPKNRKWCEYKTMDYINRQAQAPTLDRTTKFPSSHLCCNQKPKLASKHLEFTLKCRNACSSFGLESRAGQWLTSRWVHNTKVAIRSSQYQGSAELRHLEKEKLTTMPGGASYCEHGMCASARNPLTNRICICTPFLYFPYTM